MQFLAQEEHSFQPALIVADYPPLDFTQDPGEARYAYAPFIRVPAEKARNYNNWYIDKSQIREITASPVMALREELESFPPVLLIMAEQDTLTEGSLRFAQKLMDAGVTVTAKCVKGAPHGFTVQRKHGFEVAEKLIFDALKKVSDGTLV